LQGFRRVSPSTHPTRQQTVADRRLVGEGTGGANLITDTFDTPFGDFNIPTDFDMAALASFADFAPFG
jgi:hypothetical protein